MLRLEITLVDDAEGKGPSSSIGRAIALESLDKRALSEVRRHLSGRGVRRSLTFLNKMGFSC